MGLLRYIEFLNSLILDLSFYQEFENSFFSYDDLDFFLKTFNTLDFSIFDI